MTQIRHDMEMKEAKKIAEQKRREKMEEQLARYIHNAGLSSGYFQIKMAIT